MKAKAVQYTIESPAKTGFHNNKNENNSPKIPNPKRFFQSGTE